jgi:hypothetical protein
VGLMGLAGLGEEGPGTLGTHRPAQREWVWRVPAREAPHKRGQGHGSPAHCRTPVSSPKRVLK